MERSLREVKLPKTGYTVSIVEDWTYGEQQQIQEVIYKSAKTSYKGGESIVDVSPSVMLEANKRAMMLAIRKIVDTDGNDVKVSWKAIEDLPVSDGKLLADEIDAMSIDQEKK